MRLRAGQDVSENTKISFSCRDSDPRTTRRNMVTALAIPTRFYADLLSKQHTGVSISLHAVNLVCVKFVPESQPTKHSVRKLPKVGIRISVISVMLVSEYQLYQ